MNNPQERDAWLLKRIGKATASRIGDICKRSKRDNKPLKAYDDYLSELVLERLTGRATDHFVSDAMERGTLMEPQAALHYAMETGHTLAFSDFVDHPTIAMAGASPDRLVNDDGLLEIKCPMPKAHMEFIMSGLIPENYQWQMLWQIACAKRSWCEFNSYNPDFPGQLVSARKIYEPPQALIAQAEEQVSEFLELVTERTKALEERANAGPQRKPQEKAA